ncbi:hypothetical protein BVRB_013370 [Beta vulgaris subsp. vulgaris]|uniref:Uncharacterized protein n=1 Tax=Beta vulgaris subsp. vulgaris TaxID=3555 RepID=A0A0J8B586_BETVV|nr:hypothetical protein BVRB_013370 [Beta vulgaris subsp. vulgaris]
MVLLVLRSQSVSHTAAAYYNRLSLLPSLSSLWLLVVRLVDAATVLLVVVLFFSVSSASMSLLSESR